MIRNASDLELVLLYLLAIAVLTTLWMWACVAARHDVKTREDERSITPAWPDDAQSTDETDRLVGKARGERT